VSQIETTATAVLPSMDFQVDVDQCNACGLCTRDCPMGIIEGNPPRVDPEKEIRCVRCQHCLAICPTGAISLEGRKASDSLPLTTGDLPSLDQIDLLIRSRRSIRQYQNKDVDPELLRRLLNVSAYAPTGVNARALTFTVIDRKRRMADFREQVFAALTKHAARIPDRLQFLASAPTAYAEHGIDILFRTAPHLIIASAPTSAPCGQVDVPIALAAFELLAVSAGLGTVWCGLLKAVLETLPELKTHLDMPVEGIHYYPMLFGHPAVEYARTVQRDGAAIVNRLS